jgi:hypothetical protein
MTVLITGLSLSFIAIGVLYYLNNELKKRLERNNKALLALQKEFTQYQVSEKRIKEKDTAKTEIRHDNIARSIKQNEDRIHLMNKTLPEKIRKTVGHIEFARPLDRK